MAIIEFSAEKFRLRFPYFTEEKFPDEELEKYWEMAICYISATDYGCLSGDCRELAIQLMTAHLAIIGKNAETGDTTGFVNSATIDKITVSLTPPPAGSQYTWWLSLTTYGQQLLALLKSKVAGGCYIGGSLERQAFRKVGGNFYG
jgi:hypothetical protein